MKSNKTLERDRGPFVLTIGRKKRRFRDADHFGNACMALSRARFVNKLDYVNYAYSLPNGYTSFVERDSK